MRTGPEAMGAGAAQSCDFLSVAVCVCGSCVCITHQIRPWTSRPPKRHLPANKREKKPPGGGGLFKSVMPCQEDRPPAQFVAPARPGKSALQVPTLTRVFFPLAGAVPAGGETKKRACLLGGLTGRTLACPLAPIRADLTQRCLADGHAVQRLIS